MGKLETISHIKDVALMIFSEYGYSGSSMDSIAEKAKVNKATIYYHIGNKEKLYTEVIKTNASRIIRIIENSVDEKKNSKDNIRSFVKAMVSSPEPIKAVFRLMLREVSTGFATIPEDGLKSIYGLFTTIRRLIIIPGIEKDELKEKDPFLSHAFLISSSLLLNVIPDIREKLSSTFNIPELREKQREKLIDQYIEMLFYGLYGKKGE